MLVQVPRLVEMVTVLLQDKALDQVLQLQEVEVVQQDQVLAKVLQLPETETEA